MASITSGSDGQSSPTRGELLEMYRQMFLIRRFDEVVRELRLAGEIDGVVHAYIGQEAIAVGVCSQLKRDDRLTSTHRGHGHCIAKGADPRRMMAELFGRRDGYCRGKGGSMHIADFSIGMLGANGIVAAGLPIALGSALASEVTGDDVVTVCMFGDGATGAGPFHECLNIAALWKLPIVFVCESNGWSASVATESAIAPRSLVQLVSEYGIPSEQVDGNSVIAVRDAASRAIDRARSGNGPGFLNAVTYRMSAHAYRGTDQPDTRDRNTLADWEDRDPIEELGAILRSDGAREVDSELSVIHEAIETEIRTSIDFARLSPLPELSEALEDVFAQ